MQQWVLAQETPLGERLLVAAVGPLITVVVGGLLVWAITSMVTRRREAADKAQQHAREDALRRHEELRADTVRNQERARADDELRQELISAMTDAAGTLYLSAQHYWRAKRYDHDTAAAGSALDAQYLKSRATGEILENRLEGYFARDQPRQLWHRVMDLLTVRYFQLHDRDTEALYRANQGDAHSGLSAEELRHTKLLLTSYHKALKDSVRAVLETPLRDRSKAADG